MARKPRKPRKPHKPRKPGRPSKYTAELAGRICQAIADGGTIREICGKAGIPPWNTVRSWLIAHPEFHAQYARAREDQADALADKALRIAAQATPQTVNVARLQVDTIKWRAGKLKPKVYGDRASVEHSGPEGGPIQSSVDLKGVALDVLKKLVVDDDTPEDPQE